MTKTEIFNIFYGKDTSENYNKFKKIESSIECSNELYQSFDDIASMLNNSKTSIKVRGFRIICKLAKWDKDNKINDIIEKLLNCLDENKGTAVRQCLEAVNYLLLTKKELSTIIKKKLLEIDCTKYKDTLAPLIKKDISNILKLDVDSPLRG